MSIELKIDYDALAQSLAESGLKIGFFEYVADKPFGFKSVAEYVAKRDFLSDANVKCGDCNACCKIYEVKKLEGDEESLFVNGVLPREKDGTCSYLIDGKCSVYDRRPKACRRYDCRDIAITRYCISAEDNKNKNELNNAILKWNIIDTVNLLPEGEREFDIGIVSLLNIQTSVYAGECGVEVACFKSIMRAKQALHEIFKGDIGELRGDE